jgi:ribosomal protein S18 acetylase RimI-like enzyme
MPAVFAVATSAREASKGSDEGVSSRWSAETGASSFPSGLRWCVKTKGNTEITIRRAGPSDCVLLAEFGAKAFRDAFGADNTPENMEAYLRGAFAPDIQAGELAEGGTTFLIAESDGGAVGYARLRKGGVQGVITGDRPVEIVRFYSASEWIGKGVGSALMVACLEHAVQMGHDVIWLDVWEHNPRAIAFYRKWGFRTVGTQAFQLGDDLQTDLLMQRSVAEGWPERAQHPQRGTETGRDPSAGAGEAI